MASGDTKTEALLDILGNGGDASSYRGCCNTKTQSYILDAIDRVQNVEDEVEELKNNPDVVDVVATYADLQAYDTQHLTDKDIIRVLQDETHDGESTYYRYNKQSDTWTYIGESKQYTDFVGTDGTTAGEAGLVPAPAITDAGKFLKADGTWAEVASGGESVITLTSADYNYPIDNPTRVSLWDKESGFYTWANGVRVAFSTSSSTTQEGSALVFNPEGYYADMVQVYPAGEASTYTMWKTVRETGVASSGYSNTHPITTSNIVQSTGTSAANIMSQNAVTSMIYADPAMKRSVRIGNSRETGVYSLNIGYSSGSSAGEVSGTHSVGIGADASIPTGSDFSVAIGSNSRTSNYMDGTVALGAYSGSNITAAGMMDIGSSNTTYGYNSTNYRLLSGVHDPVGAHDAATKGYVDGKILSGAGAPTTSTAGTVGQVYQDTTNAKLYICTAIVPGTDPDPDTYTWAEVGAGGGSGPTVVQTTGTSTTDVMSQNAVSKLVYVDPSSPNGVSIGAQTTAQLGNFYGIAIGSGNYTLGSNNIAIGRDANAGNNANRVDNIAIGREAAAAAGNHRIAIGNSAGAANDYSVALGAEAKTSRVGEVNVGTGSSSHGYNSTSYRVIGGVHDGQGANDAVNVSQVNSVIDNLNSALNINIPHIGAQS